MSTDQEPAGPLSPDQVAVLAKAAGLSIAPECLPALAEQLEATSRAAERMLTFPDADVAGVASPFDPAWPVAKRGAK